MTSNFLKHANKFVENSVEEVKSAKIRTRKAVWNALKKKWNYTENDRENPFVKEVMQNLENFSVNDLHLMLQKKPMEKTLVKPNQR